MGAWKSLDNLHFRLVKAGSNCQLTCMDDSSFFRVAVNSSRTLAKSSLKQEFEICDSSQSWNEIVKGKSIPTPINFHPAAYLFVVDNSILIPILEISFTVIRTVTLKKI